MKRNWTLIVLWLAAAAMFSMACRKAWQKMSSASAQESGSSSPTIPAHPASPGGSSPTEYKPEAPRSRPSSTYLPEELIDVQAVCPQIHVEMLYACDKNFVGMDLYDGVNRAFLRASVAARLKQAQDYLNRIHPGHFIKITDAYRPLGVQSKLWDTVKGTPNEIYVSNPVNGKCNHCRGVSVDVTLVDRAGKEIDMGTPVDSFEPYAEPRLEDLSVREGVLTHMQVANRKILRDAMGSVGFKVNLYEWWHFDAFDVETCKTLYDILDVPLAELIARSPGKS